MNKRHFSKFIFTALVALGVCGCSHSSDSSDEFVARSVEKKEIYDIFQRMYETRTYHQRIYGDEDIFDFIYHGGEYISQSGGDINYSAITLPSYKAGEDFDRVYMAKYTVDSKGHRDYYLGEAIYLYDFYSMKIVGPETSLEDYDVFSTYGDRKVTEKELSLDTKKDNTYVMRYNSSWYDNPDYTSFYFFVGSLIQGDSMLGAGRLKKIEMQVSTKNVLRVTGYINELNSNVVIPYFQSDFFDIGSANDADLEEFLASDKVKISSVAPTKANFANIFEDHISTDTDIYEVINGKKNYVGSNHLDFDSEHAHIYGIEGNKHYSNISGNLYQDFIDGGNSVFHDSAQLPYSVINGLKNNVDVDDFRQVDENKFRYYGINFEEVFGDLSETSVPAGWNFSNLYVELKDGLVDKYVLETSIENAVLNDTNEEVEAYYIFEVKVVTPRTVEILAPYERNDQEATLLENALAVLNDMKVEFKVHGEEHSSIPDDDNKSVREVTYALDYVYEEYKYTKPHMDANANFTEEDIFDKDGYFLNKDSEGNPTGITEFKFNHRDELVATKPLNEHKKSLYDYWYYAEPAAEIFDYNPETRTFTSKPYTGYFAAILIKKAFKTAADNFMDEVRITLNETLDRVETIEYDVVWRFSDGWSSSQTGRLDFTYDIDTEPLREQLKAMKPYEEPSKWSDSARGVELTREFDDYFKGAKDCHGNDVNMDMIPYLYDEQGDSGWVGVQFTIAGELWMINDNGCKNPTYMKDLAALFDANPDFEYIGAYHHEAGEKSYRNGDMIVSVFPKTMDGVWFTNTAK